MKLTKKTKFKLFVGACAVVALLLAMLYFWFGVRPGSAPAPVPVPEIPAKSRSGDLRLYPDPKLTPGDVFENVTAEEVCIPGYATRNRKVSQTKKKRIHAAYGVPYPQPRGAYEVDHFIALELGGSNSEKNLWMQPCNPRPGCKEKNRTANWLHREVCKKRITLREAQEAVRSDWYAVYLKIPKSP